MGFRSIFLVASIAGAVTLPIGLTAHADPILGNNGHSFSAYGRSLPGLNGEQQDRFTFDDVDPLGGEPMAWWDVQAGHPAGAGDSRASDGGSSLGDGTHRPGGTLIADAVVLPAHVLRGGGRSDDPYSLHGHSDWPYRIRRGSVDYDPDDIDVPDWILNTPTASTPAPGAAGLGLIGLAIIALRRRCGPRHQ